MIRLKKNTCLLKSRILGWGLLLFLYSEIVFAQNDPASSGVDATQMLINLNTHLPAVFRLISAFSYVLGFIMAVRGVYYLKLYGELRTMTASQTSLRTPVTYLIAAAALMFMPTVIHIFIKTSFGYDSPLRYDQINSTINPILLQALVGIVQLVGFIAFIRGWLILIANASHSGGGQNSMGKALTHIIGGVLAINIVGLVDVLWNTFGFKINL